MFVTGQGKGSGEKGNVSVAKHVEKQQVPHRAWAPGSE
jgi:hypothetical protein